MPATVTPRITHLYISPGHNYFGHHGLPPGSHSAVEMKEILCQSGRGIVGDRFFDYKDDYKGQITFFAEETFLGLSEALRIFNREPSVFRRNVITRGTDLNSWINREFELQGIRFWGTGECSPCHWMDQAFGPGANAWLKGKGGLRAQILTTGTLRVDA